MTVLDDKVLSKLREARADLIASGKPEAEDYDAEKTWEFIKTYANYSMVSGYLVAYAVDVPWYGTKPVLIELLVLRLSRGGTFRKVTDFLERVAHEEGCSRIAAGTLLAPNDEPLARLYERAGFHRAAVNLSKEI